MKTVWPLRIQSLAWHSTFITCMPFAPFPVHQLHLLLLSIKHIKHVQTFKSLYLLFPPSRIFFLPDLQMAGSLSLSFSSNTTSLKKLSSITGSKESSLSPTPTYHSPHPYFSFHYSTDKNLTLYCLFVTYQDNFHEGQDPGCVTASFSSRSTGC